MDRGFPWDPSRSAVCQLTRSPHLLFVNWDGVQPAQRVQTGHHLHGDGAPIVDLQRHFSHGTASQPRQSIHPREASQPLSGNPALGSCDPPSEYADTFRMRQGRGARGGGIEGGGPGGGVIIDVNGGSEIVHSCHLGKEVCQV